MTQSKKPAYIDSAERLRTAQHEMSHAIVSYALECQDIQVAVFKRPRSHPTRPELKSLGMCQQRSNKKQYQVFVACGPFVSAAYSVDSNDEIEFKDMVEEFTLLTGKSAASFRYSVFDPVKNLLDSKPAIEIITKLSVPIAMGGILKCKKHTDMEKFFPKTISLTFLHALCRSVKEAADELPVRTRQNA